MTRQITQWIAFAALSAVYISVVTMFVIATAQINLDGLAFGSLTVLLVISAALLVGAWLSGLMLAARMRRWDWFVGVFVLGPVGGCSYAPRFDTNLISLYRQCERYRG